MEKKTNDLWAGGPWEQPSRPVARPIYIPEPQRPVLRVKKRRRFPFVPILLVLTAIAAVICGVLLALGLNGLLPAGFLNLDPSPFDNGDYSYGDYFAPSPFPYEKYEDYLEQPSDYSTPPSIPAAGTGSGVTVAFSPAGEELSYEDIYRLCAPSIVSITAEGKQTSATGTGIVLTADGYIITNAHVIAGAEYVDVLTSQNILAEAKLVGFDAREDLAVLKVELDGLTPAAFGSSDELTIGQEVAAIGDALGYRSTITDGIISALNRDVTVDDVTMNLIQTSAPINFGNSGGALIDRHGRVVGVTTIKLVANDGSTESMGFAIPSTRVKYVVDKLIAGEEIIPAAFGLTVNTIPVDGAGLEVLTVEESCDAWAKGLRPGDILMAVNGQPLTGVEILSRLKCTMGVGDTAHFTVVRGMETLELDIALSPLPAAEGETP